MPQWQFPYTPTTALLIRCIATVNVMVAVPVTWYATAIATFKFSWTTRLLGCNISKNNICCHYYVKNNSVVPCSNTVNSVLRDHCRESTPVLKDHCLVFGRRSHTSLYTNLSSKKTICLERPTYVYGQWGGLAINTTSCTSTGNKTAFSRLSSLRNKTTSKLRPV